MRWLYPRLGPLWSVVALCLVAPCGPVAVSMAQEETPPAPETPPPAPETPAPPAPAPPPPTPAEPAEDEDRITFNIRLAEDRGGGRVEGFAGDFEYQPDQFLLATGGVRIKYRDVQLQADTMRIDIPTETLTAEGSVVLDEGPNRLVGDAIEYNLETRTGRVTNARAFVGTEFTFTGDQIAKVADDVFTLDDGTFTSCSQEVPPWSLRTSHARITLEEYARIRNARFKLRKVPVLYLPYILWPTRTERSSGFLVPQPGYSDRRGFELSLAYYKTLGRSADTTFFADLSSNEYYGFGNELRYRPSETTEGLFDAFILTDPDLRFETPPTQEFLGFNPDLLPEETRWKVNWYHESREILGGFRGVVNFQDYSDPAYRQDFERDLGRQSSSFIYSQAYLTRNSGQHSFNLLVDQRERVRVVANAGERLRGGQIVDTRRQLPEVEYRLRPTQLGGAPVYFSLDGNLHYLSIRNSTISNLGPDMEPETEQYGRGDLAPGFLLPLSTLPWLSARLDVGGRVTHYTNSLDPATGRFFAEQDKALTRSLGTAGAEIVGPSFSRIFDRKKPKRFSKLKHIVEPRFVYGYADDFEDDLAPGETVEEEAPLFDELDNRRLTNETTVSLINRLLAKPADEEEGGAFEIASFEIQRSFSHDSKIFLQRGNDADMMPQTEREGPLRAILRVNPSPTTSFKAEGTYNTLFGQMQALSLSGGTRLGRHSIGGTLYKRWGPNEGAEVTSNQARVFTTISLVPDKLTFDANVSFDLVDRDADDPTALQIANPISQRYFLNYVGSCYSLQLEFRESRFSDITDRDFRFTFTLKNVGTFIDLNGSID